MTVGKVTEPYPWRNAEDDKMELKKCYNPILRETLYEGFHESGLRYYIIPKEGYNKSYAVFATKYGSIDSVFKVPEEETETEVPDGIAHFLEHKMFDKEDGNIFDKFSLLGSSPNAFTSFNMTAYLFSCTDNFYDSLNILLDFVQKPYFSEESVKKEQGIIGQEINMYDDDPNWRVFFNLLGAMYHKHPVYKDIAGTIKSISKIDKDILYKCYNTFYTPSNMVLLMTGDIDIDKTIEIVDKNIVKRGNPDDIIERIYPQEPDTIKKPLVEQQLSVSAPLFQLGFKDINTGLEGEELLKKDIMIRILLEMIVGKSSNIYKKLYEEGIINDSFEADATAEKEYFFTIMGGESTNPIKVRDEIVKEINSIGQTGLNSNDFERIKKVIMGRFLRQFNSIEKIANAFVANVFKGINLFDYVKVYEAITFEDVSECFTEHFNTNNMALSIVKPY